ncbi:MAG: DUF2905 domain-containing protein, partial [Chloroflexi bacterium]|nr:DUF2905 domain-containing protein [Chloroflexota bacterium]
PAPRLSGTRQYAAGTIDVAIRKGEGMCMFDVGDMGKLLVMFGVVIVVLGLALSLFGRVPFFGRLPGDLALQGQGVSCFVPIVSSIVLSIVLTFLLNLVLRLLNR